MKYTKQLLGRFLSGSFDLETLKHELIYKSCEVEETKERVLPDLVVIGKVTEAKKHPDADKLTICQLDCGHHGLFQICTGATNIREHIYVPVALPGCYLPALDLKIDPRTMRGVASNGMICSKEELGIAEDLGLHGIWILQEVTPTTSTDFHDIDDSDLGKSLHDYAEWLSNWILDVENKTITHRPDMFGHFGLAREIAALFPEQIRFSRLGHIAEQIAPAHLIHTLHQATITTREIDIESPYVGAYSLIDIENVVVQQSSLRQRLHLIDLDITPKNNWIDFSTYFMYLTGQPIHCFDADTLQGTISVRQATEGEQFVDLFDETHTLTEQDIVIADEAGILALAGIVGGKRSSITQATTRIAIEIAQFDAVVIRKTAMRLGIRTDAQTRFEKDIFPWFSLAAILLCLDELEYLGKTELGDWKVNGLTYWINDVYQKHAQRTVHFDVPHINRLLGTSLTETEMSTLLGYLGLRTNEQQQTVALPVWRGGEDLQHTADIAEEVARIYGFDRIEGQTYTTEITTVPMSKYGKTWRSVETLLTDRLGYTQIETYPWIHSRRHTEFDASPESCLVMENSMAPELALLRPTMIPSLLEVIEKNAPFFPQLHLYDIGATWQLSQQPAEQVMVCFARLGEQGVDRSTDLFLQLKQDVVTLLSSYFDMRSLLWTVSSYPWAHTQQQTDIFFNNIPIGKIATLHPRLVDELGLEQGKQVVVAEISFSHLLHQGDTMKQIKPKTLQDQLIWKDVSFVIPKHAHYGHISDALLDLESVQEVKLVDIYSGAPLADDEKSISISFLIQGDGSLTNDQVTTIMQQAIAAGEAVGGKLRG